MLFAGSVDTSRDAVVFVADGAAVAPDDRRVAAWAANYNVAILGADADVEAVRGRLETLLSAGMRLRACIGAGAGGRLAYRLACSWRKARGESVTVVLGDTACDVSSDALDVCSGRVILLDAAGGSADNAEAWRRVAPDLTVVSVVSDHAGIVGDGDAAQASWAMVEQANRLKITVAGTCSRVRVVGFGGFRTVEGPQWVRRGG